MYNDTNQTEQRPNEMYNFGEQWSYLELSRQKTWKTKNKLTAEGVKDVWDKWDNPNYSEYKERNAWSLVNAFTERGRGRSIFQRHGSNNRLLEIVKDYAPEAAPKTITSGYDDDVDQVRPVSSDF